MTGDEHHREAERLLAEAREAIAPEQGDYPIKRGEPTSAERYERAMKEAQVHATLAMAAALEESRWDRTSRPAAAPRPEPAAPDVPFMPKRRRVEFGGADGDPTEWGSVAGRVDRVAPADLTQQDAYQDPQEYGSGYLMPPQQPPSPPWRHVPSRTDPDHNADTASPSGTQPPDTAHDEG
jgi:hypothetical protein